MDTSLIQRSPRPEPKIVEKVFSDQEHANLVNYFKPIYKKFYFDEGFGRYSDGETNHPLLKKYFDKTVPIAREIFNSQTLLPSYALFTHYEGPKANLFHHTDDNACTYTLDMCVYQSEPWDLYVENQGYTLQPNQALAYYGEDQEHWREAFPNPENQHVAMIFFHYVEPEHWWYAKGPRYIEVMRGLMTEQEWEDAGRP